MKITIPERPGRCRWCGCTFFEPCDAGCGWVPNTRQTLCTECRSIDRLMRTIDGRAILAKAWQITLEEFQRQARALDQRERRKARKVSR